MSDDLTKSFIILFVVLGIPSIIIIQISIIRWVLRINTIVKLLESIDSTLKETIFQNLLFQKCDGCGKKIDRNLLLKIDSGQRLCPDCIKILKK